MNLKSTLLTTAISSAMLFSAGCAKESTTAPGQSEWSTDPVEILLSGGIATAPASRAVVNEEHGALQVSFARLDQKENDGFYDEYTTLSASLDATIAANTGNTGTPAAITFDAPQYYLSRKVNNSTKLVGWYPRATPAAGVVTLTIDGENDIMLSQELDGNKAAGSRFGEDGKVFAFEHLLTQLKVKAYGADAAAVAAWGTISSIKIKGQANSCKITLPTTVAFEGTADLALPAKTWDNDSQINFPLTIPEGGGSAAACGYAMIQPVANSGSLTLIITTATGGEQEVEVPLPAAGNGFVKGMAYEVVLKFTAQKIVPTATISAWTDGEQVEVEM